MLRLGTQDVSALYLGGMEIKKAYLGADLVFGATPTRTYTVTATIDPADSGSVTGTGEYQEGTTVTLTATPADGYNFTGWRENGAIVSTDSSYTFTVSASKVLIAVFTAVVRNYNITVSVDPPSGGMATGAGIYEENATVTVTATPNSGYRFVKWVENEAPSESVAGFVVVGDNAAMRTASGSALKVTALAASEDTYQSSYTGPQIDEAIGKAFASATMEQVDAAIQSAVLDSWEGTY